MSERTITLYVYDSDATMAMRSKATKVRLPTAALTCRFRTQRRHNRWLRTNRAILRIGATSGKYAGLKDGTYTRHQVTISAQFVYANYGTETGTPINDPSREFWKSAANHTANTFTGGGLRRIGSQITRMTVLLETKPSPDGVSTRTTIGIQSAGS